MQTSQTPVADELFTRIRPRPGWIAIDFPELWAYRELLFFLTWRNVRVRYAQTILGGLWAIIQPLFTMVIFTFIFNKLGNVSSGEVDYKFFSFAALVPWTLFSAGISQSANSLVGSANLLRRVYFPRLVIPLAAVMSAVVDFLLAFAVLLVMVPVFEVSMDRRILWVPVFSVLAVASSLGIGLWLSAMNVQFRDVKHALPFLTQFLLLATPIGWQTADVPERFRTFVGLNPMAGVVEGFRWAVGGQPSLAVNLFALSSAVSLGLLASGAIYFRRMEKTFADVV